MDGPDGHGISWDHQGRNFRAVFCHILPPHSNGLTPKGIYAESGAMTWSPLGWVQEHLVWWPLWDLPPRPQHEKVQCNSNISAVDFLASLAHLAWSGILRMRETRRAQRPQKPLPQSLAYHHSYWQTNFGKQSVRSRLKRKREQRHNGAQPRMAKAQLVDRHAHDATLCFEAVQKGNH